MMTLRVGKICERLGPKRVVHRYFICPFTDGKYVYRNNNSFPSQILKHSQSFVKKIFSSFRC